MFRVVVLLILILSVVTPLSAQQRRDQRIGSTPCQDCSVRVERVASIGGPESPLRGLPKVVVEDGSGNLVVMHAEVDRQPPIVFDRSGQHIGSLGKAGQGPGEVTPVRWLATDSGGRVEVYSGGRVTLFSSRQEYVSTTIMQAFDQLPADMIRLGVGQTAWLTQVLNSPGPDANPISIRGPKGEVIRQLHLTPHTRPRLIRELSRADHQGQGLLWVTELPALESRGYDVILIDTLGHAKLRLERHIDWWWSDQAGGRGFTPLQDTAFTPYPFVHHVREDARGRLLVLLSRPRPNWKAVPIGDRFLEGNFRTIVEVLDPASAQLVGRAMAVGWPIGAVGDSRFATYREDADGDPVDRRLER
jgi:hypothetical protein